MAQTADQPRTSLKLLLVDDHEIVRLGLRLLLESRLGWTVVGEAACCADGLALAREQQPDIIVLDLKLGSECGVDLIPGLRDAAPDARILVLTAVQASGLHERAVAAGVTGIVLKDRASAFIVEAVAALAAGELWLDRAVVTRTLEQLTRRASRGGDAAKISSLTKREREVIPLLCEGLHNRDIARRLHISEATTRHHLTSIFAKLEVSGRLELIVYALGHKLVSPPHLDLD